MDISYSNKGGPALLVALVGLQQTWGVEFSTAVDRAHEAIREFTNAHMMQTSVSKEDIVELMKRVAPGPG